MFIGYDVLDIEALVSNDGIDRQFDAVFVFHIPVRYFEVSGFLLTFDSQMSGTVDHDFISFFADLIGHTGKKSSRRINNL